mgnify:CR=1 FL=1
MSTPPVIVTLISDVFLAAPVESAVRAAGYRLVRIERGSDLEPEVAPEHGRVFLGYPPARPVPGLRKCQTRSQKRISLLMLLRA